jgi:hypothetical protein
MSSVGACTTMVVPYCCHAVLSCCAVMWFNVTCCGIMCRSTFRCAEAVRVVVMLCCAVTCRSILSAVLRLRVLLSCCAMLCYDVPLLRLYVLLLCCAVVCCDMLIDLVRCAEAVAAAVMLCCAVVCCAGRPSGVLRRRMSPTSASTQATLRRGGWADMQGSQGRVV